MAWGSKVVEEVGFEKVRRMQAVLPELRIIVLDDCHVAGVTSNAQPKDVQQRSKSTKEIGEVCPNITELDLSRNVLENWEEVVGICTPLKQLKSLRVKCVSDSLPPRSINSSQFPS